MEVLIKYCKRCDHDLPLTMFGSRKGKDGSRKPAPYCLWCEAERHREWMAKHPGKAAEYQRRWRKGGGDDANT